MKKLIPNDATLIPDNAQRVFKGEIFEVYQWPQTMFDGSTATFEMIKRPDLAIVIGIVDDQILLVEDEQPNRSAKLGFPGGRVDLDDESVLAAAQREMREETGYSFANWRLVKVRQPDVKTEWFVYAYIADTVLDQAEQTLDTGGERISLHLTPFAEVRQWALARDGKLGLAQDIFEAASTTANLLALPEYLGREIER